MALSDPLAAALLIGFLPAILVLLFFFSRNGHARGRGFMLLLGSLSVTLFYVFAPDPFGVFTLYSGGGDLSMPLLFALVSGFFLVAALFVFRSRGGRGF